MPPTTSNKRKSYSGGLQRRVRARREEPEPEPNEYLDDWRGEESEDGDLEDMSDGAGRAAHESDSASDSEEGDEEEDEQDDDDPPLAATQMSFGALARAQASMPRIRRKTKGRGATNDEDESQDEHEDGEDQEEAEPNDRRPPKPPKPQRSSKHAPTEMSSKRMVSRKREVVSAPRVAARDPRFSAASGPAMDEARARRAYAFLDEYREAEMAELKASLARSRSAAEKEELARALKSMQSRKEAQARRDAERDLVARHRRAERELVARGKQPFYLKKSEQKRRLLVDRFAGMKKKQVDRSIERRRKKLAARERKNTPVARRGAA